MMKFPRVMILVLAALTASSTYLSAAAPQADRRSEKQTDYRQRQWDLDARVVLGRGGDGTIDRAVVGDPCIVWDDEVSTWRMFYFASGLDPVTGKRGPRTAMALAASAEQIGPGDWRKTGLVPFTNPDALINPNDYHKWWVVMDAQRPNHAARIDGKYWAVFAASKPLVDNQLQKHIQVAFATSLAGPWTLRAEPILAPGTGEDLDSLHADTPSAFWFEDRKTVAIYYKGYPKLPQSQQAKAPFGSGTMLATWNPADAHARKVRILMRAGQNDGWNQGWMSSIQLFPPAAGGSWYGLHNASPTPPADRSHREPAPSLGGWLVCDGHPIDGEWRVDPKRTPFRQPQQLTEAELNAGLGVNFWRHHLLVTPSGQARIFFNSGAYGKEQMYSLAGRN